MKKFLVIGNPINHSLSPKLHNFWIKKYNLEGIYNKKKLQQNGIEKIIKEIKKGEIDGINVTVPFKKIVISYLDNITPLAKETNSVNIVYKKNNNIVGDNTDVGGFECSLKHIHYNVKDKKVFVLGAGGVSPSIIFALKRLGVSKIFLSNRTRKKAEDLKKNYPDLEIIEWGDSVDFDMIVNATSLGLEGTDKINLSNKKPITNKLFYDVIYNPSKTDFLLNAEKLGNKIVNGKMMFIYQAQLAFKVWHNILPKIDTETIKLLNI